MHAILFLFYCCRRFGDVSWTTIGHLYSTINDLTSPEGPQLTQTFFSNTFRCIDHHWILGATMSVFTLPTSRISCWSLSFCALWLTVVSSTLPKVKWASNFILWGRKSVQDGAEKTRSPEITHKQNPFRVCRGCTEAGTWNERRRKNQSDVRLWHYERKNTTVLTDLGCQHSYSVGGSRIIQRPL